MNFDSLFKLLCEGTAPRSYSCLMLDCPSIYSYIKDIHDVIDPADVYDSEAGHSLEKETHITVKYGIHTCDVSEVFTKIKLIPVTYKIKGLSLFQNDKFDVLKFDIESKDLHKLNKQVCDNLDTTDKFPTYSPHCTVGYLKCGTGKYYTKIKSDVIGKTFTSNRFIFSDKNSNKVWKDVISLPNGSSYA